MAFFIWENIPIHPKLNQIEHCTLMEQGDLKMYYILAKKSTSIYCGRHIDLYRYCVVTYIYIYISYYVVGL